MANIVVIVANIQTLFASRPKINWNRVHLTVGLGNELIRRYRSIRKGVLGVLVSWGMQRGGKSQWGESLHAGHKLDMSGSILDR